MILGLHNSIYFWGAIGLVYVYFQFQQPQEIRIDFDPAQIYINAAPDTTEVRVMCWNEITQSPTECK